MAKLHEEIIVVKVSKLLKDTEQAQPIMGAETVASLEQVLKKIVATVDPQNLILSIMHSEADATDAALEILHRYWSGPVAIYPNSGNFVDLHLQFDEVCSETEFEQAAQRWLQAGVQIVGGCCGIGPAHIRRLGSKLLHS